MFKKSESKEVIDKARNLYQLIQNRKLIEAQESILKDYFKLNFPDGVSAAEIIITTKNCSRTNLDKKQLQLDLGDLSKYENATEFVMVEVRRVG